MKCNITEKEIGSWFLTSCSGLKDLGLASRIRTPVGLLRGWSPNRHGTDFGYC